MTEEADPDRRHEDDRPPLLTVQELAEYFKVSKGTIRAWIENEDLPHGRLGRHIRFDPDDIDRWLSERWRWSGNSRSKPND